MLRGSLLLLLVWFSVAPARATVTLVADGSAPGAPAQIHVHGAIRKGDYATFERLADLVAQTSRHSVNGVPFVTVRLSSPGGDVMEALKIGSLLNRRWMMTLVRPHDECVSACVFIAMAGVVRTASGAAIGVHRPEFEPASRARLTQRQADEFWAALEAHLVAYFETMQIDARAYTRMMSTRGGLYYFSPDELRALGFTSEQPAWTHRYAERWAELYEPKAPPRPVPVAARRVPAPPAAFLQLFRMPGLIELPDSPPPAEIFQRVVLRFDAVPAHEIAPDLWTFDQWRTVAAGVGAQFAALFERYFLLLLALVEMLRAQRRRPAT
ncbi:hypothetical protein [Roseiterribacter gracilis]|uniref:Peptidase S49 domain-containing protein n=1 Tax=Roseiterribacter gracilis TaxID=2812848 RepID=A0A8S8XAP0_9PROT|nr:hypothetical protein TMPK1_20610 [Rhodospirillales bacterium TMPK1]